MDVVSLPRRPLRMSLPIAVPAMIASAAGVFLPSTYAAETPAWAAQAAGQDLVNLFLVFPVLVILAHRARRGSVPAYLMWLGLLGYTAYSYLLYAGYTRFSGWFPVCVAILGMSGWTLRAALPTDPVLVLDLAFVLPGMAVCGVLVRLLRSADPAVRMVDVVGRPRDWSGREGQAVRAHAR